MISTCWVDSLTLSSASISIHLWIWPMQFEWLLFPHSAPPYLWIGIHLKKSYFFSFYLLVYSSRYLYQYKCMYIKLLYSVDHNAMLSLFSLLSSQIVSYFGHCEFSFCVGSCVLSTSSPSFLDHLFTLWIKRCSKTHSVFFLPLCFRIC